MMLSVNICQNLSCTNASFAYCPHCSLNICIDCFHEHYELLQDAYKEDLKNFNIQLNNNYQMMINQEKKILQQLFQIRSIQYNEMKDFLIEKLDFHMKTNMRNFHFMDCLEIKRKYASMMNMYEQYYGLLNEITQSISDFQTNRNLLYNIGNNNSPNFQNDYISSNNDRTVFAIDTRSVSRPETSITIELNEDETSNQMSLIDHSEISQTINSNNSKNDLIQNQSIPMTHSIQDLKEMFFTCPFTKYTLGLQKHQYQEVQVANIPCQNLKKRTLCLFQHLLQHHAFNAPTALNIIRVMVYASDRLDQIDLFSHQSIESLISNRVLSYIGQCPLYKTDVYGILPSHRVKLCTEDGSKNICLHRHLRSFHKISYRYATRLVEAVIKNINEKTPIIKLNDDIHRKT